MRNSSSSCRCCSEDIDLARRIKTLKTCILLWCRDMNAVLIVHFLSHISMNFKLIVTLSMAYCRYGRICRLVKLRISMIRTFSFGNISYITLYAQLEIV